MHHSQAAREGILPLEPHGYDFFNFLRIGTTPHFASWFAFTEVERQWWIMENMKKGVLRVAMNAKGGLEFPYATIRATCCTVLNW